LDENNISIILNEVKIACLSLDGPTGSVIVARECKKRNIPVIEAWSFPYLFVWWFTANSLDYETCYNLDTKEKTYSELKNSPDFPQHFRNCIFSFFKSFPKISQYYSCTEDCLEKMRLGELSLRSFSPLVYLTGSYVALDIVLSGILGRKKMVLAPNIKSINLFETKIENFRFENY
jgi:hypothetical protein